MYFEEMKTAQKIEKEIKEITGKAENSLNEAKHKRSEALSKIREMEAVISGAFREGNADVYSAGKREQDEANSKLAFYENRIKMLTDGSLSTEKENAEVYSALMSEQAEITARFNAFMEEKFSEIEDIASEYADKVRYVNNVGSRWKQTVERDLYNAFGGQYGGATWRSVLNPYFEEWGMIRMNTRSELSAMKEAIRKAKEDQDTQTL